MADRVREDGDGTDRDVTMYRPSSEGGLEPVPSDGGDYRERLRSRRWRAAPLTNPEIAPTDPRIAVAFIVGLLVVTFVLLVAGYASGFWG
jgi:hypothetical protein